MRHKKVTYAGKMCQICLLDLHINVFEDFLTDVDQIDDKPQVDHQDKGSIFYFEVEYFSYSCLL